MKRLIALFMALSVPVSSFASPFQILGLRTMGMGGAGVAVAEGPTGQYWNPGGLSLTKGSGFQLPVAASFEATGDLLDKAKNISDVSSEVQAIQNDQKNGANFSLQEVANFNDALVKLTALNTTGTGVLAGVNGGADVRVGRFAMSVNNFTEAGVTPFVDTSFNLGSVSGFGGITIQGASSVNNPANQTAAANLASVITQLTSQYGVTLPSGVTAQTAANNLVNQAAGQGLTTAQITNLVNQSVTDSALLQASGNAGNAGALRGGAKSAGVTAGSGGLSAGAAFADNTTHVQLAGASLSEATLGYGFPLPMPQRFGDLGVGANAKIIRGDIGYDNIFLLNGQTANLGSVSNNMATSYKPGLDLGALYRAPFRERLQAGFLARNINSPSFEQPAVATEAGVPAFKENSQMRTGIAWWPWERWAFSADADVTKNDTEVPGFYSRMVGVGTEFNVLIFSLRAGAMKNVAAGTPLSYTAGIGLNAWALKFDLGGAISSKTVNVADGTTVPASFQLGLSVGLVFGAGPSSHSPRR